MFFRMGTIYVPQTRAGNGAREASCWWLSRWLGRGVVLTVPISRLAAGCECHLPQMLESFGNWAQNSVPLVLTRGRPVRVSI